MIVALHEKQSNKKRPSNTQASSCVIKVIINYLTASFKALPGLNAGTLLAGIWIS